MSLAEDESRTVRAEDQQISVVDIELDPGGSSGVDIDIVVLPDVESERPVAAPEPQVFASNARFRPIVMAIALAVTVAFLYGLAATVSLFRGSPGSGSSLALAPAPMRVIGQTPGLLEHAPCRVAGGRAFVDHDGNGARSANEAFIADVALAVRGGDGQLLGVVTTDADGAWSLALPEATRPSVELLYPPEGLWPGPRLGSQLGTAATIAGPGCSLDLGFVWIPVGGAVPSVAHGAGGAAPAAGAAMSALLPGSDSGVQVHGRAWVDSDSDGRFSVTDRAVAGMRITVYDADDMAIATVMTGPTGLYSVLNLDPRTRYSVGVDTDHEVRSGRVMGGLPFEVPDARVHVATGDIGLTVWGLDFLLASERAAPPE